MSLSFFLAMSYINELGIPVCNTTLQFFLGTSKIWSIIRIHISWTFWNVQEMDWTNSRNSSFASPMQVNSHQMPECMPPRELQPPVKQYIFAYIPGLFEERNPNASLRWYHALIHCNCSVNRRSIRHCESERLGHLACFFNFLSNKLIQIDDF